MLLDIDGRQKGGQTGKMQGCSARQNYRLGRVVEPTHAMTKKGQGGELLDPKRLVHALAVEAVKYISSQGKAVLSISPWLWYAGMSKTAGNIVSTRQMATPKRFLLSSVAQTLHRSSGLSNFRVVSVWGMAPSRSALRQS